MARQRGGSDILTFQRHNYSWLQRKGPGPNSPLELFSMYGALGGAEEPSGETEAVYRKALDRRHGFRKVGKSYQEPETFTASFTEGMPRATAAYLERLKRSGKPFSVTVISHQDADPQDPSKWESKNIYEGFSLTSFSYGDQEGLNSDDEVQIEAEAEYERRERVFPIKFGQVAATEITVPVIDVAVYPETDQDDVEEKEIYILTAVVTTTAPALVYRKDGVWSSVSLTGIGNNAPDAIAVVGDYIIVVSAADGSYSYARRSAPTAWTTVTDGFVASKGPTAIYAPSVGKILFAAQGGYIYKLTVPGSPVTVVQSGGLTAQDLADIDGLGDLIVAVGASNAVLYSRNDGRTWSTMTGPAPATALNAVAVQTPEIWWIGADGLFYTEHADRSAPDWHEKPLGITGLATVDDVKFTSELDSVGYVAANTASAGTVLRTTDGGTEWETYSLADLPANVSMDALAVGGPNFLLAGGVATGGTDGIAAIAVA